MSSCGTVPYRPRRSFSSPIISSLQVQPFSFTSRNAKSPGSGTTTRPGVPQAPSIASNAIATRFMQASLHSNAEPREDRHLILELQAPDPFHQRDFDGDLE